MIFAEKIEFCTQNRHITFSKPSEDKILHKNLDKNEINYFWVAFDKNPDPAMKKLFHQKGIQIQRVYSRVGKKLICVIKTKTGTAVAIETMKKSGIFAGIEEIEPLDKISPNIFDVNKFKSINTYDSINQTIKATISFLNKIDKNEKTVCC